MVIQYIDQVKPQPPAAATLITDTIQFIGCFEHCGTVAMESTGIYINAIRTVLRQRGMRTVVVNPYLIKQIGSEAPVEVWKGGKAT